MIELTKHTTLMHFIAAFKFPTKAVSNTIWSLPGSWQEELLTPTGSSILENARTRQTSSSYTGIEHWAHKVEHAVSVTATQIHHGTTVQRSVLHGQKTTWHTEVMLRGSIELRLQSNECSNGIFILRNRDQASPKQQPRVHTV